jgi:aspartyl-tRNA(Asn)/glutamyl-tRNA(Gln) amidotransferase subunit C
MLSKEEVKKIAHLARIHLEEKEVDLFTQDLTAILDYIEKLTKLDVSKVEPTSHVLSLENVFRPDDVKPSLKQDEAMKFSVENKNGFYKVPQVIE